MKRYTLTIKDDILFNNKPGIYSECEKQELTNDECLIFNYFPEYKTHVTTKQYNILDSTIIDRYNKIDTDRTSCFVYLLYDSSNLLDYCYTYLPNILQCVEEYEKKIDSIKIKMFFRIYLDISTFLLDKTNSNHIVVMNIFDKLLKTNLVELHQITYPNEIKKTHSRRIIRFLSLLDNTIDYYYSKDIDGIFTHNDIALINTLNSNMDDMFVAENYMNNSLAMMTRHYDPKFKLYSKYKLSHYPIYKKHGSSWLTTLYNNLMPDVIQRYGLYFDLSIIMIPAGLYITNLKITEEEFNKYYTFAKEFVKKNKLENMYLDEIFLNYLVFNEKQIKMEDGMQKLYVLPDTSTPIDDIADTSNDFNFDINRAENILTYTYIYI